MEIHVERGRIRSISPNSTSAIVRTEHSAFEFPGATILPGFVDNHCHLVGLGTRLVVTSLHRATSIQHCIELLGNGASDGLWISGMGWNETGWSSPSAPHKRFLDEAFPNTPVVATRVDGHTLWVNSKALELAGVESETGIVSEGDCIPIYDAMPAPSTEEIKQRILAATKACVAVGITEVHDMDVHPSLLPAFIELAEAGKLPIRVQSFVSGQHNEWSTAGVLPSGGEYLRIAGVKMYADGALGSRTAALHEEYADDPGNFGILTLTSKEMSANIRKIIDADFPCVAIHAIGDRAVTEVIDAYEEVRSWSDGKDVLLRMEHAQIVREEDVKRLAELNVWCCVQPTHALSDCRMAELRMKNNERTHPPAPLLRRGEQRLHDAYRWNTLLKAGVRIAGGSDFPIEDPSPLAGIDAFVRRTPVGYNEPWNNNNECITQQQAVDAFTLWAHESADMHYRRGKLEIGYDADLVVLDRDPRTCRPEELLEIKVLATFTSGQLRYNS